MNSFTSRPTTFAAQATYPVAGSIKQIADDFVVEEDLGLEPDGQGSHVLLQIRKRDLNTMDVVKAISRVTAVPQQHIGLCGLKDKQALTTQWFSVPMEMQDKVEWAGLDNEQIETLNKVRHGRKLRRGSHRGNRFKIRVRNIEGDLCALDQRLHMVGRTGVPNYFGPQRFGYSNLDQADALFDNKIGRISRSRRSILLSAVRAWLFNQVLAARVRDGNWNTLMEGDVAMLAGSNSFFKVDELTPDLSDRLSGFDIHPSGPLFGAGENPAGGKVRDLESHVFDQNKSRCAGLIKYGLRLQRRPTRLEVRDLTWRLDGGQLLEISFCLGKGAYATSVLSEFMSIGNPDQ